MFVIGEKMSTYKDTLTLYEEFIATGVPESQAKIQAHQLGAVSTYVGDAIHQINERMTTKFNEMDERMDNKFNEVDRKLDKDLVWMRVIGAAMIVAFLSNAWFH